MTKASTEKYWERRHLQTKAKEIKNTESFEKALQPELNGLYRELHGEMEKWYARYGNGQGIDKDEAKQSLVNINTKHWQLTLKQFEERAKSGGYQDQLDAEYFRSRVARLQDLEQQLRQVAQPHANRETASMRNGLAKQYDDTYMRTTYTIQASKGAFTGNFARFNEAQLRMVVSQPWAKDGKDFSKRIWKNYQKDLPSLLTDSVMRSTLLGYSPQKASQLFHASFQGFRKSDVHRLITSEMGHVAEEAAAQSYEENEIDQYEYMATLESHTCTTCGNLDGQKFKVTERKAGINYPLIHPYCRCTTVPYIEDLPEINERWSRNPETGKGKMIKDVKFSEWKNIVEAKRNRTDTSLLFPGALHKYFSKDDVVSMNNALISSPEAVRRLWQRYQDRMVIEKVDHKGESYFLPSTGKVTLDTDTIYARNEQLVRNKYDVVFHELGHAIDTFSGKISMDYELGLKRTLNKDFEIWMQEKIDDKVREIDVSKLTGKRKLMWDHGTSQGKWNGHKILFNSQSGEINRATVREIVYSELNNTRQRLSDYETNEISLAEVRSLGDVSDMICAASENDIWITMGHGADYYRRGGHQEAEAFAEMTSATINNPESLKQIQKVFPNAYEVYLKMVNKAIGADEHESI